MTHPIKAKIQELVPEVMEKRLGCKIISGGDTLTLTSLHRGGWWSVSESNIKVGPMMRYEIAEILGSPITLAVVLRAIRSCTGDGQFEGFIQGEVFSIELGDDGEKVWIEWDLTKDNYDYQSEETKAFIGQLLGVI